MELRFVSAGYKIRPYRDAPAKYGWPDEPYGLPVAEGTCFTAIECKKDLLFKVERARSFLAVDPQLALDMAKKSKSYFTSKFDDRLFIVIPKSICYGVEKVAPYNRIKTDLPKGERIYE